MLVAIFLGKKHLSNRLSLVAGGLYTLAAVLFITRYFAVIGNMAVYSTSIEELGLWQPGMFPRFLVVLYVALFVLATTMTLWLLFRETKESSIDS